MKRQVVRLRFRVLLFAVLGLPFAAYAQQLQDRIGSPYFQVIGEDLGTAEAFPLQATSADVEISGVIADVRLTQIYHNRGKQPIEAIYVFPGSIHAAVYAMQMQIGERVINARIAERSAARNVYHRAKSEGKRSSLLEQQRPNVFQMNVANIMPGDSVTVELRYTELLVPESGVYEFVFPAVVGPRYSENSGDPGSDINSWVNNPYLTNAHDSPHAFSIDVRLHSGLPIQGVHSSSHDVNVRYEDQARAHIGLADDSVNAVNRDYILQYQLQGGQIESGILLHEGEQENYFLLMVQPPQRIKPEQVPPREYIFVVDISGSMHGFPLDTGKQLMAQLLAGLKPTDRFNILFFSGGATVLAESSLEVTPENIQSAVEMMERLEGGGGTRLLPALQRAMELPPEPGVARSFIILTDGYVSVEIEAFEYVRNHLDQANFFAFGIGTSVNRYLIEGLARAGHGQPFIMTSPSQARSLAGKFREYIETPVLTDIQVDFNGFDVDQVQPDKIPDLFAQRPIIVSGKWRGDAKGSVAIRGLNGSESFQRTLDVIRESDSSENAGLRYLWARQRIADLGDYHKLSPDSEYRREITSLGLAYNLLTAYTSFVAVDETTVNPKGVSKQVKQPLPLAQGVSDLAIAGAVPTTPEPDFFNLLLMTLILLLGLGGIRKYRVGGSNSRIARPSP